ncbi:Myblike DNAbinding domain-containing protein [Mortierella polycephala]|uniref:Myblike DNAbinding domain-containing protein n=1 Tax=Mortierella polycephala TaxID=41804 RepID=A0A9P6PMY9_9FUNG|nr:Myblike DNAbinding domain-containing protein [Mortierella polycephala]
MTTSTAASSPKLPNQIAPGDESCRALHPWTVQEIHYLRQIVGASSGYILWSEIAQEFTDRTAFECSLRWSQIRAEDKRIRRNNKAAGAATLRSISKQINSETEQDTEKNDSPSTKEVVIKTGRWSRSEDKALHSGVEEHLRTYGLEALPPVHLPSDADLKKTDQSTQPAGEIRSTGSGWCSQSSHSRSAGQSSDEGRYSHDGTTMAIDDGSELFDEIVDTSYVENNDDDDGNGGACGMNVETGADAIVTGDSVYRHMHQKSIINPDEDHPSEYHGSRSVTQDPHLAQSYRWHKHRQGDSKSYVIERLEAMTVSPRRSELRYQPEQWCRDGEERAVNGMSNIHESVQETAMQQQQSFQRSQEYYLQRQGGTTWNTAAPHPAIYPGSPLLPLQHSMPTLSPIDGATLTSTLPRGYGQATGSMDPGACSQPPSCQAPQPCGDGWNASTLGTDGYCFNVWEISSHHQELEYGNMAQTWNDTNGSNTNAHDMDSRDESGSGSSSSDDASTNAMIYNLQFAISQLQQSRELKTRQCHQEPIQLHQKQEQESRGQPSDPFLVAQPHNPSALSSSSSSSFSSMIALSPEWLKSTLVSPGLNEHRSAIPMTSASSTESSTTSHSPSSSPQTNTHTAVQSAMGTGGIDGKDFGAAVPRRVENTSEEITGPQSNAYDSSHDNHANAPPTTAELNFNKNLNTREEYTLAISRAMATCPWNLITHSSIPGRTGVQAQARWSEALDPQVKKGKWSPDEDALLLKGVQQSQKCWIWIADGIPGRTQRQCRTRWVQISARYEREAAVAAAHSAGNGQPLQALAK